MNRQRLIDLPKAEVHIHLEGCFELDEIVQLAEAAGEPLLRPREQMLVFEGLSHFLEYLDWSCGLVRTRETLSNAAYQFSRRMARSGVGYADVIVNPTHWAAWKHRIPEMITALDEGFTRAEKEGLPPVGLCLSLLRTQTEAEGMELVEIMIAAKNPRVVALSVDGNEARAGRTGPRFASVYQYAGKAGFKRTVHAGESSGPDGVWDAIQLLGADRIDHGVRAIEDPALVKVLADRKIALGICPVSNLYLKMYPSLKDHPLDQLRRAGVPVSINTDDPAHLNIRLENDYADCAEAYDWNDDVLREMAAHSIHASFAPERIKSELLDKLARW